MGFSRVVKVIVLSLVIVCNLSLLSGLAAGRGGDELSRERGEVSVATRGMPETKMLSASGRASRLRSIDKMAVRLNAFDRASPVSRVKVKSEKKVTLDEGEEELTIKSFQEKEEDKLKKDLKLVLLNSPTPEIISADQPVPSETPESDGGQAVALMNQPILGEILNPGLRAKKGQANQVLGGGGNAQVQMYNQDFMNPQAQQMIEKVWLKKVAMERVLKQAHQDLPAIRKVNGNVPEPASLQPRPAHEFMNPAAQNPKLVAMQEMVMAIQQQDPGIRKRPVELTGQRLIEDMNPNRHN